MAIPDDHGSGGPGKRDAEASFDRIDDDIQKAKERITGAAAGARDDVTATLQQLIADVASLKDTITILAKTTAAEVREAGSNIGEDITSTVKGEANSLLSEFDAVARRNPLGVVIGAFGLGMLLGLMKGRSR